VPVEGPAVHLVGRIGREQRDPALDVADIEGEAVPGEQVADRHVILGAREHGALLVVELRRTRPHGAAPERAAR
jgi:hypothetical protein